MSKSEKELGESLNISKDFNGSEEARRIIKEIDLTE